MCVCMCSMFVGGLVCVWQRENSHLPCFKALIMTGLLFLLTVKLERRLNSNELFIKETYRTLLFFSSKFFDLQNWLFAILYL